MLVRAPLTELRLSENFKITDVGWKAIAEGVGKSAPLTSLNLYRNKIGDEGAQALAKALPK